MTIGTPPRSPSTPPDPAAGPGDSRRMDANRAAVAANQAYRAGDLDQARQLIDQAAALDPSRAGLWQQHREQIAARRLILDAQAFGTEGDQEEAQRLLIDAQHIDPRMPAAWEEDRQGAPPAQLSRQVNTRASASLPRRNAKINRSAGQESGTATPSRSGSATQRDRLTPQPSWPTSLAPREPHRPAAIQQVDAMQSRPQKPLAAVPDDSRANPVASGDASGASTEPANSDPATRWPAPNPHAVFESDAADQQAQHGGAADQESPGRQQTHGAKGPESGAIVNPERSAPLSADWRDELLGQGRQPWHPPPSWPHNPVMNRPPEADGPYSGMEPGY